MAAKIRIRTTQRDLRNQHTSTEHGRVSFDAQGVTEVEPHVAQFLLTLPSFLDHDGSAAKAGLLPIPENPALDSEPSDPDPRLSDQDPDLSIEDLNALAEPLGCKVVPIGDPDMEITITDDEIIAIAQSRNLILVSKADADILKKAKDGAAAAAKAAKDKKAAEAAEAPAPEQK